MVALVFAIMKLTTIVSSSRIAYRPTCRFGIGRSKWKKRPIDKALAFCFLMVLPYSAFAAEVAPGDVITPNTWWKVQELVSPGNLVLVRQGMVIKVVSPGRIEVPPMYKAATEQYASQVRLNERGELLNYVAGLPFPFIDPNDPQAATKAIWNFSYGPQFADEVEIRNVETYSYRNLGTPGTFYHFAFPAEWFHSTVGHVAWYNNVGRTEVLPIPRDPNANPTGIRYRYSIGPVIEPSTLHGKWLTRIRYLDPTKEDFAIYFGLGRVGAGMLDTSFNGTLDPNSYSGFAAKVEDFNYRLLGIAPMLASVHAASSPPTKCAYDDMRTVCPENWEMRNLYVVEATYKSGAGLAKRLLYIDSEGWFITASDQYDRDGALWKTLVIFNAYRDRSMPGAQQAVYPFRRIFESALVDEDIQSGFSTVSFMPGYEHDEREGWFIDSKAVSQSSMAAAAAAAAGSVIHAMPGSNR
jgi:hypothetical protein